MSYHEQIWLDECTLEFKPKFYRRYVDDIFILISNIEHVDKFKEYLNCKHRNINFTSLTLILEALLTPKPWFRHFR